MQVPLVELARFLLIGSECHSLIPVDPILLTTLAGVRIVSRSHSLEGDHDHVRNTVSCCIEMRSGWCFLVFGQDVASVLVEPILSSP